jgi:hypothetical protein
VRASRRMDRAGILEWNLFAGAHDFLEQHDDGRGVAARTCRLAQLPNEPIEVAGTFVNVPRSYHEPGRRAIPGAKRRLGRTDHNGADRLTPRCQPGAMAHVLRADPLHSRL